MSRGMSDGGVLRRLLQDVMAERDALLETQRDLVAALRRAERHFGGPHVQVAASDPDFVILEVIRGALTRVRAEP